jgi:hypothetical protein
LALYNFRANKAAEAQITSGRHSGESEGAQGETPNVPPNPNL